MAFPACGRAAGRRCLDRRESQVCALGRYTTLIENDEREVARMTRGYEFNTSYDVSGGDLDAGGKSQGRSRGKGNGKEKNNGESKDGD